MVPLIGLLLKSGLGMVANAALVKGKDWIKEKTGVDLNGSDLSPDQLTQLKQFQLENEVELRRLQVEDNRIEAEVRKAELAADVAFNANAQETARVEAQSLDEYVRRTRPHLARRSAYATFAYILVTGILFPIANAVLKDKLGGYLLPGPDTWIIGAAFAPCLAYMGARTIDAFSKKGK